MASDDEDDYLSEKFLQELAAESSKKPLTYAQRRKQAQKQSEEKNVQNRKKSRREREEEARKQALEQSLFERAQAERQERGVENKAMSMMLRMGFKPGESLGRSDGVEQTTSGVTSPSVAAATSARQETETHTSSVPGAALQAQSKQGLGLRHRTVPLAVDIWSGKKGVGLGKRAPSPGALERASKAARIDENTKHETYRSHTREAFEERRVLGQLSAATRTLLALDEKAGIQFNILSLNPQEPETIPSEILEALSSTFVDDGDDDDEPTAVVNSGTQESEKERLRKQMEMDALQPLETLSPDGDSDGDDTREVPKKNTPIPLSLSRETMDEAREFLRLNARDRLQRVLKYLREKYHYCLWCGTQYNDKADLDGNCPGEDEEAHD